MITDQECQKPAEPSLFSASLTSTVIAGFERLPWRPYYGLRRYLVAVLQLSYSAVCNCFQDNAICLHLSVINVSDSSPPRFAHKY